MKIPLIDLSKQNQPIIDQLMAAHRSILERSAFILGPECRQFEEAFAAWFGAKHGIGCASGTDALYLALMALDIGPGDEVVTTTHTFSATVESIHRVGARPVLVDIEPTTYNMDPRQLESAITAKTRAIMPVHIYGQAVDMDVVMSIARRRKLHVIEDCAQAHGATWKGRKVGTFGEIGCFSFFPSKNLGSIGDAGACITDDESLAKRMERIRVHGRQDKYESIESGANSRLDTIHAAVLLLKLPFLDEWNRQRREVAAWYDARLTGDGRYVTPSVGANREHVYHIYVIQSENREAVAKALTDAGIGTGIHYPMPVHLMRGFAYLKKGAGDYPVSERVCRRNLSLPMFPGMTEGQVDEVCRVLLSR